jgi:hypothetical protein
MPPNGDEEEEGIVHYDHVSEVPADIKKCVNVLRSPKHLN